MCGVSSFQIDFSQYFESNDDSVMRSESNSVRKFTTSVLTFMHTGSVRLICAKFEESILINSAGQGRVGHRLGPSIHGLGCVELGWVGSEFFNFWWLGWVGWRLDCVIFLTS